MEDEDGYTMMTPRGQRGAAGRPGPLRDAGPGCPPWHRTALWASCLGHLVLGAAVVALGSWAFQRPLENVGYDNTIMERFVLELRKGLCPSQSPEGEGCRLCPTDWTLNGNKCYWVSNSTTLWSWTQSREDCENRGSELLVPEDQDELDSISRILPKPHDYFWIGLSYSTERGWTWLNGSRLDQSWLSQSPGDGSKGCAMLKGNRISSELCSDGSRWICRKGSTQL